MSSVRKRVAKGASLVQIDDLENEVKFVRIFCVA